MAIFLPGAAEDQALALDELTPREIVAELDKYVVGQHAAKRAVAIALRNRMRRQKLAPELADDIMPKNIIMIGPTGVGKTEIARRLAKLTNSPFLKVEASKFTEVGYVGRDVESIVRDLVEIAIDLVREEKLEDVEETRPSSTPRIACSTCCCRPRPARQPQPMPPPPPKSPGTNVIQLPASMDTTSTDHGAEPASKKEQTSHERTREKLRQQFREGKLDDRTVELDVRDRNQPSFEFVAAPGQDESTCP